MKQFVWLLVAAHHAYNTCLANDVKSKTMTKNTEDARWYLKQVNDQDGRSLHVDLFISTASNGRYDDDKKHKSFSTSYYGYNGKKGNVSPARAHGVSEKSSKDKRTKTSGKGKGGGKKEGYLVVDVKPTPLQSSVPTSFPSSSIELPSSSPTFSLPFCSDFVCPDGYIPRGNAETRIGDDRESCCIREGVCAGAAVGSPCSLGDITSSLIPNPSFENFTLCPNSLSQLSRAVSWVQATEATSDYFVGEPACPDYINGLGIGGSITLQASDGVAFVGAIFQQNPSYVEYIGGCLLSPLQAGVEYTFNLDVAATRVSSNYGGDTNGVTELLCIPSCDEFQIPGTDYKGDDYEVLATATPSGGLVENGAWKTITFVVTPTQDCPAIMFGPGPTTTVQSGWRGSYTVYDFLNLQEGSAGVCNADGTCVEV